MAKKTMAEIELEKKRQEKRYQWIVEKSKIFDKNLIYKYYEANTADPKYIQELKDSGQFEKKAISWWIGNVWVGMETGHYDETTFDEASFVRVKEEFELPAIKEQRLRTISWVNRQLARNNPELAKNLDTYGADFNRATYAGSANNITQIVVPSRVGNLLLLYDPSNQTFTVQGTV
jgi:hypothetical protein